MLSSTFSPLSATAVFSLRRAINKEVGNAELWYSKYRDRQALDGRLPGPLSGGGLVMNPVLTTCILWVQEARTTPPPSLVVPLGQAQ